MLKFCAAFWAVFLCAVVSVAETNCDLHDKVVERLAERYGESPVGAGVAWNGGLVELFINETAATWSIVVTDPGGVSCLASAGEGWRRKLPPAKEERL